MRFLLAAACAARKSSISVPCGATAKFLAAIRMAATAILKSRLASASSREPFTVAKEWPTSRSPET